jgi:adenylate kinase
MASSNLKIYYSCSVRGSIINHDMVVKQIACLGLYGEVLTKHLASKIPAEVDMNKTDPEIYSEDISLLEKADIVVLELSSPSIGVGFIAGKQNKRTIGFIYQPDKAVTKLSAMINGNPHIHKHTYSDIADFETKFQNYLYSNALMLPGPQIKSIVPQDKLKIFVYGPPGAGKSTIGKTIAEAYNIKYISSGDLVRDAIKSNKIMEPKLREFVDKGLLVPAHLMKDLVLVAIGFAKSYILDGYPFSISDLNNMCNSKPDIVLHFSCDREIAVDRQCSRAARSTDNRESAMSRVSTYFNNVPNIHVLRNIWFRDSLVIDIDANQTQDQVYNQVTSIMFMMQQIEQAKELTHAQSSYLPIEPRFSQNKEEAIQCHFHVDATPSVLHAAVFDLYYNCPELHGLIKIYPISNLVLGGQVKTNAAYGSMPNFHEIIASDNESFVTGFLGINYNTKLIDRILRSIKATSSRLNACIMTEFEQYVNTGHSQSEFVIDNDLRALMNASIPNYEYHMAFDVKKSNDNIVDLKWLNETCIEFGFPCGGWFIFAKQDVVAYRTNSFSETIDICFLENVAKLLSVAIKEKYNLDVAIGTSAEIVDGIWTFN